MENFKNLKSLIIVFVMIFLFTSLHAQDKGKAELSKQYIYQLKLIPELLDENNWTEKENKIVGDHFNRLKELTEVGIVIMAGRTLNSDESQFGIVIFKAADDIEAEKFMKEDPAVKKGIMTARIFPFRVALLTDK